MEFILLIGIPMVVLGLGAAYFVPCTVKNLIYGVLLAYSGSALYRTYKIWRCPACGRLLGDRIDIDACPSCAVRFR